MVVLFKHIMASAKSLSVDLLKVLGGQIFLNKNKNVSTAAFEQNLNKCKVVGITAIQRMTN